MPRYSRFLLLTGLGLMNLALAPAGTSLVSPVRAQTTGGAAAALVAKVDDGNVEQLPTLLSRRGAVSVGATREGLESAPQSLRALQKFVSEGGVAFLHTDAAQLFGFATVPARRGSNVLGGQLFGRARAALPFGAHPLLGGARTQRSSDATRLPGVQTVFYTLREGDVLVTNHPAGTPLLEAVDLAQNSPGGRALYACALAPYGRGWAMVVPEVIDVRRGDGAIFSANIRQLVPVSPPASATDSTALSPLTPRWIGVSQALVTGDSTALAESLNEKLRAPQTDAPALPALESGPVAAPPSTPSTTPSPVTREPVLLLESGEASAIAARLQTDAASVQRLLRARVAILRGEFARASSLLADAPPSGERAALLGVLASAQAAPLAQSSLARATFAREAAIQFAQATTTRAFFALPASSVPDSSVPASTNRSAASERVAGLEVASLRAASAEFNRLATLFAAEPPLFQAVGSGASPIIFRYFEGDASSPALGESVRALADARAFGWRVEEQEVLLFPTEAYYAAFRRASGATTQNVPFPSGAAGDVVGSRILMVTLPATPTITRLPNGQTRVLPPRNVGLAVLSRFQAYALLSTWLDGTGRVPAWLSLGLETVAAQTLDAASVNTGSTLENFAQAGGLLTPAQFEAQRGAPGEVAQAQAASLVTYFYRRFGAGAVTETVQRLGTGQPIGVALRETTGGDENAFFIGWRNAQFPGRAFPNGG